MQLHASSQLCPRPKAARLSLQRRAVTQRRGARSAAVAKEGGVGSYLAEAASQIFSPAANDTPWSASGFSGRITHHEEVARLRTLYREVKSVRETIEGCTNPASSNYNPDANADDGSCLVVLTDEQSSGEGTQSLREYWVSSVKKLFGSNFDSANEGESDPFKNSSYSWSGDKLVSQRDISRLLNYERTVKQALERAEESSP